MSAKKVRVFIIDDKVLVRFALSQLLSKEEDIVVVGDCAAGPGFTKEIEKAKPDLIILDVPLPRQKGLKDLKTIHRFHLPIIVYTRSDKTIAQDLIPLLEAGAVGFVLKPEKDGDVLQVKDQLVHEIRLNCASLKWQSNNQQSVHAIPTPTDPLRVVAIGSSTGGPEALASIINQFPARFPAGVVIVQHMPPKFTTSFAARLNHLANIPVKEAEPGDVIKAGTVLLAPGDFHMVFGEVKEGNRRLAQVRLTKDPPQWKLRPTVDNMMNSLVPIFESRIIGIILTGMGEDGVIGMRNIKQHGGQTIVQNRATSAVFGMGQEVIKNNLADHVLPLKDIIPKALELLRV